MGGIGSGRHTGEGKRRRTDDVPSLDIRMLKRTDSLQAGMVQFMDYREDLPSFKICIDADADAITINADTDSSHLDTQGGYICDEVILLNRTAQHLGGVRNWMICSCCDQRAAIVYLTVGWACRSCSGLRYRSQLEVRRTRIVRRLDRIRHMLGWPPGIVHGMGTKSAEMWHSTHDQLLDLYVKTYNRWIGCVDQFYRYREN